MTNLRFYQYASLVLLILNILLIAFFLLTKPHPPQRPEAFQNKAITILGLEKDQYDAFIESAKRHGGFIDSLNRVQKRQVNLYFQKLLPNNQQVLDVDPLEEALKAEKAKIELTYKHFEETKSILKADQIANFEVFMEEFFKKVMIAREKRPGRPKDF